MAKTLGKQKLQRLANKSYQITAELIQLLRSTSVSDICSFCHTQGLIGIKNCSYNGQDIM